VRSLTCLGSGAPKVGALIHFRLILDARESARERSSSRRSLAARPRNLRSRQTRHAAIPTATAGAIDRTHGDHHGLSTT
jgi:hypothetical protein